MLGRAAGPDDWSVEDWLRLPESFWNQFAALWEVIYWEGQVPAMWRRARVALIPKPGVGHRPLSILCIGWRIGAKCLVASLRQWAASWLNHRTLGGVAGRSAKDAIAQLLAASQDQAVIVSQDLSKYFDGVQHHHLDEALAHVGAPLEFRYLVRQYYGMHFRIFSSQGCLGRQWHPVSKGVAQGCPLSSLLAATIMAAWDSHVAPAGVEALSFVDDRYFFGHTEVELRQARPKHLVTNLMPPLSSSAIPPSVELAFLKHLTLDGNWQTCGDINLS